MATPTIQRRRLGLALKQAREAAGKTQEEAAEMIDAAASKISRMEIGQSGIRLTDLGILMNFYGVAAEEIEAMKELARAGRQRGRWSGHPTVASWFRQYIELEEDASEIRWYQHEVVPGILQVEPYIRAMFGNGDVQVALREEVEGHVEVRLGRRALLDRSGKTIRVILSESALRRTFGDAQVMREQLRYLAEVAQFETVMLQVLPFDARSVGDAWAHFVMLRFDEDATSDVVYLEGYTTADYIDRPESVRAYSQLWDRLQAAALGPVESRDLILRIAEEMKD
ncbi:helix-turn-helix domain-containing protein [Nocardia macrotermitis]|uniref:HTH cro/C1-type domain-containing protein n=1 Tax=Nocardia macrotermitis TaxID=2585198 RepID=A0A7K0D3Z3_9NOCA|nr:helix-turn-helix transcriptional regulator [Nocardia macrotermitis]MQY20438.1 hypothetical protein [Nocardia macrotermitis]